jgi:dTDP-4-dehydrorhamnose reductase
VLARACARRGIHLTTFSSDLVFSGAKRQPYVESDTICPINCYGYSKSTAENLVTRIDPQPLVIRTSAFFGPWDEFNFVAPALAALSAGKRFIAPGDCLISPTYVPDLVNATLDLIVDGERGLWHLANQGAVTWAELARRAADAADMNPHLIVECPTRDLNLPAARPLYSVLGSERGLLLPRIEAALEAFVGCRNQRFKEFDRRVAQPA